MHGRLVFRKNDMDVSLRGTRRCQPSVRSLHDLMLHQYVLNPSITLRLINAKLFLVNDLITRTTLL